MVKLRSHHEVFTREERHCFQVWTHGLAANTVEAYRSDLTSFKAFVQKPLSEVQADDFQRFQVHMENAAPASTQRKLAALRSFYKCGSSQESVRHFGLWELPKAMV